METTTGDHALPGPRNESVRRPGDGVLRVALSAQPGRPDASTTMGQLAVPTRVVPPTMPMAAVEALFRIDSTVRWMVMAAPRTPVLVSRSWLEVVMAGRLGYGRLLHERRVLGDVAPTDTLCFPSDQPVRDAAALIIPRRQGPSAIDGVVVTWPDGRVGVAPVAAVFQQLAEQYAYQSLHDPLTGLPNRLFLLDRLRHGATAGVPGVLCYIDLDRFKDVNDHLGHAAGDQVLVEFAARLRTVARAEDLVARLGGDEFAVLTQAPMTARQSTALAERIVQAAANPFLVRGPHGDELVSLGASVGVAGSDARQASSPSTIDSLLVHGDQAMYRAKSLGRSRVAHFGTDVADSVEHTDAVRARHQMERRLRHAIETGGLTLHYQPVVALPSGRVTGVEALARWHDDELGQVPPDMFIPLAERTGLIVDLGRRVLQTACTEAAGWPTSPTGPAPTVAVNVSPVQLAERGFVDDVTLALRRSGLEPWRLCLEITETAAITDLTATAARLSELRSLGVRLALDDFGAGHSSLTLLRMLPVHVVKIDRSFVSRVTTDTADAVLVRLVVEAAHSLGKEVVAEGVEHPDQARQLVAMGCDLAQGWLFGRPQPVSAGLTQLLGERGAVRPGTDDADGGVLPLGGSDELVLVTTPDRLITYASASSTHVLGWQPAELVGTSVLDHLVAEDRARLAAGTAVTTLDGDGVAVHRVQHSDGGVRWLESTTRRLTDDHGTVREVLSVSRDVTATVQAREALAESEAMFRHAFDDAPIGMALTGLDGTLLRVNTSFAAMLDSSPEVLHGRSVADITHPGDLAADRTNLAALRCGSTDTQRVPKRYLRPDGTPVPALVHAAVLHGRDGEPTHVFAHVLPA